MSSPSPSKARILVVDDAPEMLELVAGLLRREGYDVVEAADGTEAIASVDETAPMLVLLDLTLPDLDGMEVCRRIRDRASCLILMLTARDDEVDRVLGLKTGADDYVTKPFSPRELLARVEALLRRVPATPPTMPIEAVGERVHGDLIVRPEAREVEVDGAMIELTRIEFDILEALTERPRMVYSRDLLRERVWGPDWFGDDHVVDVHIANLRKKLDRDRDGSFVRTVRGVGYRMEA